MNQNFVRSLKALLLGAIAAMSTFASAEYPERPIRLIVPFAIGGGLTPVTERIGQALQDSLGQPVVKDYRGGAGGTIAMEAVASSPPDGYTILLASTSQAISNSVYTKLKSDLFRDFVPVAFLATSTHVLVVSKDLPVDSVSSLIKWGKANPGKLMQGVSGTGNSDDLIGYQFAKLAGMDMQRIPYRGAGPAIPDLLQGRVNVSFFTPLATKQYVESGQLLRLGVSTKARWPSMASTPTIAEEGLANFDFPAWYGFLVPRGTPPDVVKKLHKAITAVVSSPDMKDFFLTSGLAQATGTPEEFGAFMKSDAAKWAEMVRALDLRQ